MHPYVYCDVTYCYVALLLLLLLKSRTLSCVYGLEEYN
jgi:hypothetical protein